MASLWKQLLGTTLALSAITAHAAGSYPSAPIRIISPYSPGGSSDVTARLVASKLSEAFGQPVMVDNRTGAGGVIGATAVANARPDGYTLLFTITSLIQQAGLPVKPPYDVHTAFTPVAEVARTNFVLVGHPESTPDSLGELIADAKKNPDKYANGSYGTGTSSHLYGEVFKKSAGIEMVHVPYQGGSTMVTALLGNQIQVAFSDIGSSRGFIESGKLRAFAATGTERFPILPGVPTFNEAGLAGLELEGWYGLLAPAGTDPAIVDKLSREVAIIMQMPDIKQRLYDMGMNPVGGAPAEFAELLKRDEPKWTRMIHDAGIKGE